MSGLLCPRMTTLATQHLGAWGDVFRRTEKTWMAVSVKILSRLFHDDGGEWRFANVVKVSATTTGSSFQWQLWTLFVILDVCATKINANPSDQVLWISGHWFVQTLVDLSQTLQRILAAMFRDMAFCHYLYYGNSWWPRHKTHKISLNRYKHPKRMFRLCKNSERDLTNPGIMLAESSLNAAFWSKIPFTALCRLSVYLALVPVPEHASL